MYGDRFHGNQWISVFEPRVWQVLSYCMEGCVLDECFIEFDNIVKHSHDAYRALQLVKELRIEYLALDGTWFLNTDNVLKKLVEMGYLRKDPINKFLKYAILLKAINATCIETHVPNQIELLTPSRILGIALSIATLHLHRNTLPIPYTGSNRRNLYDVAKKQFLQLHSTDSQSCDENAFP